MAKKVYRSWDVGVIEVLVNWRRRQAVVVVESDERRFFPVPRQVDPHDVVVLALRKRFEAVGWWAQPQAVRIDDPDLVWAIREYEELDDCELIEVDALLSMRWAKRALEKAVAGEYDFERETIMVA